MHDPTNRIAHTTAFVTPVVEHCLFCVRLCVLRACVCAYRAAELSCNISMTQAVEKYKGPCKENKSIFPFNLHNRANRKRIFVTLAFTSAVG